MPTDNRRIATYFPKDVDDRFTAFKLDRGIKGDSQALLIIVSEFLGVNQEVAYSSSPDLLNRFEGLERLVFQIQQELEQIRSLSKLPEDKESTQQVISDVPGQLNFLEPILIESPISIDLPSELTGNPLFCLTGPEMAKRLGLTPKKLTDRRRARSPEAFGQWLKEVDPDGVAWQYDSEKKVYLVTSETSSDCQDF
jgi:hypothetical protein